MPFSRISFLQLKKFNTVQYKYSTLVSKQQNRRVPLVNLCPLGLLAYHLTKIQSDLVIASENYFMRK